MKLRGSKSAPHGAGVDTPPTEAGDMETFEEFGRPQREPRTRAEKARNYMWKHKMPTPTFEDKAYERTFYEAKWKELIRKEPKP